MRVSVDWRSGGNQNYIDFCKKNPNIKIPKDTWRAIIYGFNESFRDYILETGDKGRLPHGFGEFSICKKKRKVKKLNPLTGKESINLPVDWKKSREKHKKIYIMNHHTEGYFFGWIWFKKSTRIKHVDLWWFKPSRVSSRMIAHYIKIDQKYQHIYKEWYQ